MSENSNNENALNNTKIESTKGENEEIVNKCLQICREYLGGVWLNITIDEVIVEKLSKVKKQYNQIYYCGITEDKRISDENKPQEVIIKFYGSKHFITGGEVKDQRLTDTIIALMLSENGLGAKVYGLFEGGVIMKYYKHKTFGVEEQKDPKIVKELAEALARVHAMDIPIIKTGSSPNSRTNWVFYHYDNCLKLAKERFDLKQLFKETNSETLIKYDLEKEKEWLKSAILEKKSPICFTLTDFSLPNIMLTESDGIVLIDFEYSCYNYRGHDFGTNFMQWGKGVDLPLIFPEIDLIKPFIDSYIEEMTKIKGKQLIEDKPNSFDHILNESKVFALNGFFSITVWLLQMQESKVEGIIFDKKQQMAVVESFYRSYHYYKQQFIDEGVVYKEYSS